MLLVSRNPPQSSSGTFWQLGSVPVPIEGIDYLSAILLAHALLHALKRKPSVPGQRPGRGIARFVRGGWHAPATGQGDAAPSASVTGSGVDSHRGRTYRTGRRGHLHRHGDAGGCAGPAERLCSPSRRWLPTRPTMRRCPSTRGCAAPITTAQARHPQSVPHDQARYFAPPPSASRSRSGWPDHVPFESVCS